jgi:ubiquinone/menaquinone biosynthesis C-methylase UbiE
MTANAAAAGDSAYIMGRTSEEYLRLKRQAQVWEPATKSVLERAGIAPGMHCLDAGCGPGEVMRLMAEYTGPTGIIVGLDTDANIGAEAISALNGAGLRQCRFLHADLLRLEQIDEAPFDLVFARLLLFHMKNPAEVLRRLYAWLKPGGRLVIQDYDTKAIDAEPAHEALAEFKTVWSGVCEKAGLDERIGLRIPRLFAEAGVGRPDDADIAGLFLPMNVSCQMLTAVYRSVLPLALQFGLTTKERSDWFCERISAPALADGYVRWPLLISAWKQKPL